MRNLIILLFGFIILSCQPYYKFSTSTHKNDLFRVFEMKVEEEIVEFNAYFDYYHDTINMDMVYLKPKEVRKIKNSIATYKTGKQILFLHDNDEKY